MIASLPAIVCDNFTLICTYQYLLLLKMPKAEDIRESMSPSQSDRNLCPRISLPDVYRTIYIKMLLRLSVAFMLLPLKANNCSHKKLIFVNLTIFTSAKLIFRTFLVFHASSAVEQFVSLIVAGNFYIKSLKVKKSVCTE